MAITRINPDYSAVDTPTLQCTPVTGATVVSETYRSVGNIRFFYIAVKLSNAVPSGTNVGCFKLPFAPPIGSATEPKSWVSVDAAGNVTIRTPVALAANTTFYIKGVGVV